MRNRVCVQFRLLGTEYFLHPIWDSYTINLSEITQEVFKKKTQNLIRNTSLFIFNFLAEPRPTSFTICEGSRNTINCHGKSISVLHASYGRHDRSTCPHTHIYTTSCHAGNSLGIVRSKCNSWSSCTLEATNSVFGDPCRGTHKYLKVTYKCID